MSEPSPIEDGGAYYGAQLLHIPGGTTTQVPTTMQEWEAAYRVLAQAYESSIAQVVGLHRTNQQLRQELAGHQEDSARRIAAEVAHREAEAACAAYKVVADVAWQQRAELEALITPEMLLVSQQSQRAERNLHIRVRPDLLGEAEVRAMYVALAEDYRQLSQVLETWTTLRPPGCFDGTPMQTAFERLQAAVQGQAKGQANE